MKAEQGREGESGIGSARAGYLRDTGRLAAPATILILQGETMGRPSRLVVDIPVAGGIVVSGNAVPLEA